MRKVDWVFDYFNIFISMSIRSLSLFDEYQPQWLWFYLAARARDFRLGVLISPTKWRFPISCKTEHHYSIISIDRSRSFDSHVFFESGLTESSVIRAPRWRRRCDGVAHTHVDDPSPASSARVPDAAGLSPGGT